MQRTCRADARKPLGSQPLRANQITLLHCSSREVVRAVMWQKSGKIRSPASGRFAFATFCHICHTFATFRAIPTSSRPPHFHEPSLRPAFAEGEILQIGPDLEPGRLDTLHGPP